MKAMLRPIGEEILSLRVYIDVSSATTYDLSSQLGNLGLLRCIDNAAHFIEHRTKNFKQIVKPVMAKKCVLL